MNACNYCCDTSNEMYTKKKKTKKCKKLKAPKLQDAPLKYSLVSV